MEGICAIRQDLRTIVCMHMTALEQVSLGTVHSEPRPCSPSHAGPPDMPPTKAILPAQGRVETSFSLEDEVLGEHFTRNVQFFGRPGQERIMGAFVIVVGLGVGLQDYRCTSNTTATVFRSKHPCLALSCHVAVARG